MTEAEEEVLNKKRSKKCMKKYEARQKLAKVEDHLTEQFTAGRLLGRLEHLVVVIECVNR